MLQRQQVRETYPIATLTVYRTLARFDKLQPLVTTGNGGSRDVGGGSLPPVVGSVEDLTPLGGGRFGRGSELEMDRATVVAREKRRRWLGDGQREHQCQYWGEHCFEGGE